MKPIVKILRYTKSFWRWYLVMAIFVISTSLLSLVTPFLFKQIVDGIVLGISGERPAFTIIGGLLIAIIISDILITTLTAIGQWIGDQFSEKLQTHLSSAFYKHVLSLHVGYFDTESTGKITNKMSRGILSITGFIGNMLNNFLPFFLTAFVTILVLSVYSPIIAILLAVLFPLYILISHRSTVIWGEYSAKENAINDEASGRVHESVVGIRVVKAFLGMKQEHASFLAARHKTEAIAKEKTKIWHTYDFFRRLLLNIILFGIVAYIVYWTYLGRYTIGEMTLLIQLVNQARFPLFAMSYILSQIQQASSGSKDFFAVLDTTSPMIDQSDAVALEDHPAHSGPAVEFASVDFGYDERPVLSGISFSLPKGKTLALVGESGQGKSTIVNLLLRFYRPQAGTIRLFGSDIQRLTEESLRSSIAVVFQESLLFSGTILENIRYGCPKASKKDVEAAAKAANAHEFIVNLPQGYDSLTGERGVKLSGGQKQRIAIARAILTDAAVVILDEATSALDSKSEIAVQKGLASLLHGRTSIIIAHRLSTIARADHILVLAGGKVAEQGTGQELLAKKDGLYKGLVELQAQLLAAPQSSSKRERLKAFDLVA